MNYQLFFSTIILSFGIAIFSAHADTAQYFEKIKNNPQQLRIFLHYMPKGGDLHNHLGGASRAENMIRYAQQDHLCVDPNTFQLTTNPYCIPADKLENVPHEPALANKLIDAWSMRNFQDKSESGHDHFFATFNKYGLITSKHQGEILAEVVKNAGQQNILYLELMVTPDGNAPGRLGKQIGWDSNFTRMREKLLAHGLEKIINDITKKLDADEAILHKTLACKTKYSQPGCQVKVRYLYQIFREQPPAQVFAQLLAGFILANKDSRIVGINMVQPEDGIISMRDYHLHMQMVGFLHNLYPHVHISLHAGELNRNLVSPEGLRFHIQQAVQIALAERIGHGVDIASENNATQLLKEMVRKHILVEINLTSNAKILDVQGKNHPLLLYVRYHVPVALSTDDAGVLRTNLTEQYVTAVMTYHFSYPTLKNLVRNSLTYSFLPGKSLWQNDTYQHIVPACAKDNPHLVHLSSLCHRFLNANEKANLQWKLEKRFADFEKCYFAV